jgi:hypothetical protein
VTRRNLDDTLRHFESRSLKQPKSHHNNQTVKQSPEPHHISKLATNDDDCSWQQVSNNTAAFGIPTFGPPTFGLPRDLARSQQHFAHLQQRLPAGLLPHVCAVVNDDAHGRSVMLRLAHTHCTAAAAAAALHLSLALTAMMTLMAAVYCSGLRTRTAIQQQQQ